MAITAASHLWPSVATVTTCTPCASAAFTAATMASPSNIGVGLQNRWSTPRPTEGLIGSLMRTRLRLPCVQGARRSGE